MTAFDALTNRGMKLAAASLSLLVLCALCVHMSSSGNQAVSLATRKLAPDAASMLSTKDYSLQQIKKVAHLIRLAEKFEQVGYLREGDSLPGMPLNFNEGTNAKDGHYTVRGQCEKACVDDAACAAYTYLTVTGKCYLKSQVKPGLNAANACDEKSCWYFGVITNRKA